MSFQIQRSSRKSSKKSTENRPLLGYQVALRFGGLSPFLKRDEFERELSSDGFQFFANPRDSSQCSYEVGDSGLLFNLDNTQVIEKESRVFNILCELVQTYFQVKETGDLSHNMTYELEGTKYWCWIQLPRDDDGEWMKKKFLSTTPVKKPVEESVKEPIKATPVCDSVSFKTALHAEEPVEESEQQVETTVSSEKKTTYFVGKKEYSDKDEAVSACKSAEELRGQKLGVRLVTTTVVTTVTTSSTEEIIET